MRFLEFNVWKAHPNCQGSGHETAVRMEARLGGRIVLVAGATQGVHRAIASAAACEAAGAAQPTGKLLEPDDVGRLTLLPMTGALINQDQSNAIGVRD